MAVEDIEGLLKHQAIASIPDDEPNALRAADQGFPLVYGSAQKRPIAVALRDLGAQLLQTWQPQAGSLGNGERACPC